MGASGPAPSTATAYRPPSAGVTSTNRSRPRRPLLAQRHARPSAPQQRTNRQSPVGDGGGATCGTPGWRLGGWAEGFSETGRGGPAHPPRPAHPAGGIPQSPQPNCSTRDFFEKFGSWGEGVGWVEPPTGGRAELCPCLAHAVGVDTTWGIPTYHPLQLQRNTQNRRKTQTAPSE